jgi:hypothetical protein
MAGDMSSFPAVRSALKALPGYDVTYAVLPGNWRVSYVYRGVRTAQESWMVATRAIQAAEETRHTHGTQSP